MCTSLAVSSSEIALCTINTKITIGDDFIMLSGLDLLESLLTFDATRRVSARDAIKHAYLNDYHNREPSARHPLRIEDEVLAYVPPESDGLLPFLH